jgi:hypothetical protein
MFVAIHGMNSVKIIGDSPQFLGTECDKSVLLTSADKSNLPNVQLVPTELQLTLSWNPPVGYRGGGWGFKTPPPRPRNSEVLTKLSRIPSSVENTSVTTLDIPKV